MIDVTDTNSIIRSALNDDYPVAMLVEPAIVFCCVRFDLLSLSPFSLRGIARNLFFFCRGYIFFFWGGGIKLLNSRSGVIFIP